MESIDEDVKEGKNDVGNQNKRKALNRSNEWRARKIPNHTTFLVYIVENLVEAYDVDSKGLSFSLTVFSSFFQFHI